MKMCAGLVALVVLPSLAACGATGGSMEGGTKVTGAAGYVAEYRAESHLWQLPQGVQYPAEPAGDLSGQWEVGSGRTQATHAWRCDWTKEWLDAQGADTARAAAALRQLDRWPSTHEYQVMDENGRTLYAEDLQKAHLGDPSGYRASYDVQC